MLQSGLHAACIGASRARHRCGAWWRVRRTCLRCAHRSERWQHAPEWNRMGMASPAPSRVPMVPNHDVLQRRACLFLGAAPRRSRPICSRAPNSRAPLALRSWAPRATRQAPLPMMLCSPAGVALGARFARRGCSSEHSVHWCTWCINAPVSGGCHGRHGGVLALCARCCVRPPWSTQNKPMLESGLSSIFLLNILVFI